MPPDMNWTSLALTERSRHVILDGDAVRGIRVADINSFWAEWQSEVLRRLLGLAHGREQLVYCVFHRRHVTAEENVFFYQALLDDLAAWYARDEIVVTPILFAAKSLDGCGKCLRHPCRRARGNQCVRIQLHQE